MYNCIVYIIAVKTDSLKKIDCYKKIGRIKAITKSTFIVFLGCSVALYSIKKHIITNGVTIHFEPQKRPIEGKKGIFKQPKGLKLGILALNTFRKAHSGLKW